jgi:hypothetical protein
VQFALSSARLHGTLDLAMELLEGEGNAAGASFGHPCAPGRISPSGLNMSIVLLIIKYYLLFYKLNNHPINTTYLLAQWSQSGDIELCHRISELR